MTDGEGGTFGNLLGKAQDAAEKFMDDPAKVAKAREKADEALSKHMDGAQADQVTGKVEELLDGFAHRGGTERQ